jgi:hypothetical protein
MVNHRAALAIGQGTPKANTPKQFASRADVCRRVRGQADARSSRKEHDNHAEKSQQTHNDPFGLVPRRVG